jgi:hypothetical protein
VREISALFKARKRANHPLLVMAVGFDRPSIFFTSVLAQRDRPPVKPGGDAHS